MLNKYARIVAPPETYFLEFYRKNKMLEVSDPLDRDILVGRWLNFRNHLNQRNLYDKVEFARRVRKDATSWRDVFDILLSLYAKDAGKALSENTIICEKTPLHIEFQQELSELFPQAKVIYILRDPRDVVASLKTCPWGSSSIIGNSDYWCLTTDLISRRQNSILIKYEDLVDSPDVVLTRIGNLLEIPFEKGLLDAAAPNEHKESVDPKNVASYKRIDNTFRGKWRDILSQPDHELEVIETICYERMVKYGYTPLTSHNRKLSIVVSIQRWVEQQYKRIYRRIAFPTGKGPTDMPINKKDL